MGDYYRDFSQENRNQLNDFLRTFARRARKQVAPGEPLVIDIDSTAHVQRGLEMEGVELSYKGKRCLDSLGAWDELGFCHGMELRRGRTFSSQGVLDLIHKVFSHLKHGEKKIPARGLGISQQRLLVILYPGWGIVYDNGSSQFDLGRQG